MNKTEIVEISTRVLERLSGMGDELSNNLSCEKMIFPQKENEDKNTHVKKKERRISEQELRFVFVDEFLKRCKEAYYYSVETPTVDKYSFGNQFCDIRVDKLEGQSALSDMMIYKREDGEYKRNLNIEFKYANVELSHIAKDILKLIHEPQNGAFIHLLKNTNSGTLCNSGETGVLDKIRKSFERCNKIVSPKCKPTDPKINTQWECKKEKQITIVIMSLEQKALIYQTINKGDTISCKGDYENILEINDSKWNRVNLKTKP